MDWKEEMAQYLSGEVNKYDADTFYLKHKDFKKKTGYNLLGQYQGTDYKYYVWVGVQTPEGYSSLEASNKVCDIFTSHRSYFPSDVKIKQNYSEGIGKYGIIFVMDSNPDGFVQKINDIVILKQNPEGGDDRTKYLAIGIACAAAVLLAIVLFKKRIKL